MDARKRTPPQIAWATLALVALVAAGAWRFEVEWHGWEGLTWLTYFHWAIPAGVALFLAWITLVGDFPSETKKWGFLGLAAVVAPVLYFMTKYALMLFFARGPTALPIAPDLGGDTFTVVRWLAVAWLPMLPVLVSLTGRRFGLNISWERILFSMAIFASSLPLALLFMRLFGAPGAVDAIHAIKTGYVIPLLIVGLGVPFVPASRVGG